MINNDAPMKLMLVHDRDSRSNNRRVADLITALEQNNIEVVTAQNIHEVLILFDNDMGAALIDWELHNSEGHKAAREIIDHLMQHKANMPFFLFVNDYNSGGIPANMLARIEGFIWLDEKVENTVKDIANAIHRYNMIDIRDSLAKNAAFHSPTPGWGYYGFSSEKGPAKSDSASPLKAALGRK